jgi:hypothetical protein
VIQQIQSLSHKEDRRFGVNAIGVYSSESGITTAPRPRFQSNPTKFPTGGTLSLKLREGSLYGTLVHMIKETIPELQKLSTADKFTLAVELWNELSSNRVVA